MEPDIKDYERRASRPGIIGGVPSSWAATNELNFGKDLMFDFLGWGSCSGPGANLRSMSSPSRFNSYSPGATKPKRRAVSQRL